MSKDSDVIKTKEAADLFGIHIETIRRLARKGRIPSYKVGKDWRFKKTDLLRWAKTAHLGKNGATVLVIDDQEGVRRLLKSFLERMGYRVFLASNGMQGLAVLDGTPVDVILLDLKMPHMDGPTFLNKMKKRKMNVPVVVITGYPESDLMTEAMCHGPIMLLAKPVGERELRDAVAMVLRK